MELKKSLTTQEQGPGGSSRLMTSRLSDLCWQMASRLGSRVANLLRGRPEARAEAMKVAKAEELVTAAFQFNRWLQPKKMSQLQHSRRRER